MSTENGDDQPRKPIRPRSGTSTRRLKTVVHDTNGSSSMFRHFYQSGGRDYEQYRIWLQSIATFRPPSVSSGSSIKLGKIKEEPIDMSSNVVSILPSFVPSTPLEQPVSITKVAYTHPPRRFQQTTSLPTDSLLLRPSTAPGPLNEWTVADVGRFVQKHFPEKNIGRKFIQQKIDGRTLPLLTEDHLMKIFKMKLGPALQLLALISSVQDAN